MDTRYLQIPDTMIGDRRLTPLRDKTAAVSLGGSVKAERYTEGRLYHITAPVCVLQSDADDEAAVDTQLLYGEDFIAHGERGDWYWGRSPRDHYVGWVRKKYLADGSVEATHQVVSRGTFLYSDSDLKSRPLMKIPMASQVKVISEKNLRGTDYINTGKGWLIAKHVRPLAKNARDFVMVGESMIGMTYLWAGRSTFGLDCSGFIQLAMQMAGIAILRDTDMQEVTIGEPLELAADLSGFQRGDLIFWPGHVGMMRDEATLLHANGHTMTVFSEPLAEAVKRIGYLYGKPRAARRPFALCA